MLDIKEVSAHCDIPCKIYDPAVVQVAALSVVRILDIIAELDTSSKENLAELSRLTVEKENQAKNKLLFNDYSISSFLIPELKKVVTPFFIILMTDICVENLV